MRKQLVAAALVLALAEASDASAGLNGKEEFYIVWARPGMSGPQDETRIDVPVGSNLMKMDLPGDSFPLTCDVDRSSQFAWFTVTCRRPGSNDSTASRRSCRRARAPYPTTTWSTRKAPGPPLRRGRP